MNMKLLIYDNNKLVNTLKTKAKFRIYKEVANIFRQRASVNFTNNIVTDHVDIGLLSNGEIKYAEIEFRRKYEYIKETHVYKYVYDFKGVTL